jgi:hypothetical protein
MTEKIKETIDGAEEIRDPLDGLIEKTKTDPGAPFTPEALEALAVLKKNNRAAFEKLRSELRAAGCRVTELDEALAEGQGGIGGRELTQADILVDLAQAAELFHTDDNTGFADLDIRGHCETWPIRSKDFRLWLTRRFFEEMGGAPSSEALQSALNVIESKARFDAPKHVVHIRVGGADGRIYLDLCDETWRVVEIDSSGWRVIDTPPVRFRRAKGMLPLPVPVAGGSINELRPYLNVQSDAEFVLAVAWILAALRDRGPYPVLTLFGEHGTAKSTFAMILRMLLDPNTTMLRAQPRDDHNLFIAANNGHVLPFDNLSFILDWFSDALCRLSTGGGYTTRELYTDQDETMFNVIKPAILNGIEEIVTRPDLADRSIFLTLLPIPKDKRRPEEKLFAAFKAELPRILGALLDAVATGLKRLSAIELSNLPRMADFAIWATACETAFWEPGTFMKACADNIDEAVEIILHHNIIATAVRDFMAMQTVTTWTGTATDLLDMLGKVAGEKATRAKTWPVDATRLSGRLRRAATFLREVGIEIDLGERTNRKRTITITVLPEAGGKPATSTARANANGSGDNSIANDAAGSVSDEIINQLAEVYRCKAEVDHKTNGTVDFAAVDAWFCRKLADAGPPEYVEALLARVKKMLSA